MSEWIYGEGDKLSKDDVVCILESTKATFDVSVIDSGYLLPLVEEGGRVSVNQVIGLVVNNKNDIAIIKANINSRLEKEVKKFQITKKAEYLVKKHDIKLEQLSELEGLIRVKDIEILIKNKAPIVEEKIVFKKDKNKESVVIYGAGKGGRTIFETLESDSKFNVVAFIDDNLNGTFLNKPVLKKDDIEILLKENIKNLIIGISNGKKRCDIGNNLEKLGFSLINAIHAESIISPTVKLGKGNHIKAGAIIDTNTIIGDNNIIDNGVIIPHDNRIGFGCHLAPGCTLGSSVEIHDYSILGIGSSISTKCKSR
jgi:UDP-3-O-[3-hydroxymyristoyl] glucosamine N-acyltransferase